MLRDRRAAVELFRLALDFDEQSAYSHHYLAFNLDWLAENAGEIEAHYQKAIDLQPSHPWWWSRWITYLATRGRFRAARETWRRAVDTLSISDDAASDWVYVSLHRWVARWLLHWGELDFAAEVLRSIPGRLRAGNPSVQALQDLLSALRIAEYEPAVFPLTVPYSLWWESPTGHTGLPPELGGLPLRSWRPARIEAIDAGTERVVFTAMRHPEEAGGKWKYFTEEFPRKDVESAAHEFSWGDLGEGRFVEFAYYGDKQLLRIGLHRETELRGPNILPLVPPPDRWYQHAVEESWESMKGSD
jgi:tetratricopeptide (TPR) repeat protein